jgi:hypothetical protein
MSSDSTLPKTHRAIVVEQPGKVAIKQQPLPHLDDDRLLVRVKTVALNPVDPMVLSFTSTCTVLCSFHGLSGNLADKLPFIDRFILPSTSTMY